MSQNIDTTGLFFESPTPSKKHYKMECEPIAVGASVEPQAERFAVNGRPATREQFVAACRRLRTPDAVAALARLGETL
jgi:hypothetical protein